MLRFYPFLVMMRGYRLIPAELDAHALAVEVLIPIEQVDLHQAHPPSERGLCTQRDHGVSPVARLEHRFATPGRTRSVDAIGRQGHRLREVQVISVLSFNYYLILSK